MDAQQYRPDVIRCTVDAAAQQAAAPDGRATVGERRG